MLIPQDKKFLPNLLTINLKFAPNNKLSKKHQKATKKLLFNARNVHTKKLHNLCDKKMTAVYAGSHFAHTLCRFALADGRAADSILSSQHSGRIDRRSTDHQSILPFYHCGSQPGASTRKRHSRERKRTKYKQVRTRCS